MIIATSTITDFLYVTRLIRTIFFFVLFQFHKYLYLSITYMRYLKQNTNKNKKYY